MGPVKRTSCYNRKVNIFPIGGRILSLAISTFWHLAKLCNVTQAPNIKIPIYKIYKIYIYSFRH